MQKVFLKKGWIFSLILTLVVCLCIQQISASYTSSIRIEENEVIIVGPDLVYSPMSHDFGYVIEGVTYSTMFEIWNGGTGTLTWNLGIVNPWLDVNPASGDSTVTKLRALRSVDCGSLV